MKRFFHPRFCSAALQAAILLASLPAVLALARPLAISVACAEAPKLAKYWITQSGHVSFALSRDGDTLTLTHTQDHGVGFHILKVKGQTAFSGRRAESDSSYRGLFYDVGPSSSTTYPASVTIESHGRRILLTYKASTVQLFDNSFPEGLIPRFTVSWYYLSPYLQLFIALAAAMFAAVGRHGIEQESALPIPGSRVFGTWLAGAALGLLLARLLAGAIVDDIEHPISRAPNSTGLIEFYTLVLVSPSVAFVIAYAWPFLNGLPYFFARHPAQPIIEPALKTGELVDTQAMDRALQVDDDIISDPPSVRHSHAQELKARALRKKLDADVDLAEATLRRDNIRARVNKELEELHRAEQDMKKAEGNLAPIWKSIWTWLFGPLV